jgi:hypothetical protein
MSVNSAHAHVDVCALQVNRDLLATFALCRLIADRFQPARAATRLLE